MNLSNEKILITGGGGFIGWHLAKKLSESGYNVRIFDLQSSIESKPKLDVEAQVGSILDINDISDAINGCSVIIHLAAKLGVRITEKKKLQTLNVNMLGTRNILEECIKRNVKKFIFSSSSEVYGDSKIPVSEESNLSPKSVYAISKLAGEEYTKACYDDYGLNYTIYRFFNVYGTYQDNEFVVPIFVNRAMSAIPLRIYGDGKQIRSFCSVNDIVNGIKLGMESEKANNQIYNLGNDSEPITMNDLANKIINISGKSTEIQYVNLNDSDRDKDREIYNRIPNIEKAKKDLGYTPKVSLDEGLKEMIDYYDR